VKGRFPERGAKGNGRTPTWRKSTHARRGCSAQKLIRAASAMRVRSGSTVTGPQRSATASTASKIARISGGLPSKWSSSATSGRQVCVWLRLANARPHCGQVHRDPNGASSPPAKDGMCRAVVLT